MALIKSIKSLTLDLPPSCIAFCPRRPELFVVGTYHLHRKEQEGDLSAEEQSEEPDDNNNTADHDDDDGDGDPTIKPRPQKRTGSLILFHLDPDDNNITRLSTSSTDFAILHLEWSPHAGGDVLAVATSTGLLVSYRLDDARGGEHARLVRACEKQIAAPETLLLYLTWHPTRAEILGVTLSDGRVCVVECAPDDNADLWSDDSTIELSDIHAHALEPWVLAFHQDRLLSGGDDILLQCSHTHSSPASSSLLWQDRKLHQAGITFILPLSPTLVITGSYDDHIRLLSTPRVGRKQCLAELNLDGGVWRLKVLSGGMHGDIAVQDDDGGGGGDAPASPSSTIVLLASCMHAGTRIVKLIREGDGEHDWRFQVLARFEEHQSMNYGSDVQPVEGGAGTGGTKGMRIVSTSFYDKLLCLWEFGER